jgi:hypothetical protein
LQASLNHRSRDLSVGASFTWSQNLTDKYNDRGASNTYTWDPKMDYGASGLNEPLIFVANFVYKEPFFREQHGFTGHVLGGWELSGITTFESGLSFSNYQYPDPFECNIDTNATLTSGAVNPNNGLCQTAATAALETGGAAPSPANTYLGGLGMDGPDYDIYSRPDQTKPVHLVKQGLNWFDTSAFTTAVGHFGSEQAGNILSPGFEKIDLGLMKNLRFSDTISLQLRAEAFNIFNHTNFDSIDSGLGDGTFGTAVGAHEGRKMQFSGKMYF